MPARSFFGVLWHRWWIVVLVTGIVAGVWITRSLREPRIYRAQASVVLEQVAGTADLQTEIQVIESPLTRTLAEQGAGAIGPVAAVRRGLGNVVTVTADGRSPRRAARTVNATIDAYVRYSTEQGRRRTESTTNAIQGRIDLLQRQVDALNAELVGTAPPPGSDLVSRRDALIAQQSALRQRLDKLQVDVASAGPGVAVLERATPPTEPISPDPVADALIALGAGLFLGIVIALVVEHRSAKGSTPSEETNELVVTSSEVSVRLMGAVQVQSSSGPEVISLSAPESLGAAAFRSLSDAASSMGLARGRCIEVTSAPGRQGKTETLANLAVLFCRSGHRVVVIDCDLREPHLHEYFGLHGGTGLTSVVDGAPLAEALQRVPGVDHLFVLPAGPVAVNPSEVFGSARFHQVIDSLLVGGTLVLIDTPPVLPITDAAFVVASTPVEAVVLVATAEAGVSGDLEPALEALRAGGAPRIGIVLVDLVPAAEEPPPATPAGRPTRTSVVTTPEGPGDGGGGPTRLIGGSVIPTASKGIRGRQFDTTLPPR